MNPTGYPPARYPADPTQPGPQQPMPQAPVAPTSAINRPATPAPPAPAMPASPAAQASQSAPATPGAPAENPPAAPGNMNMQQLMGLLGAGQAGATPPAPVNPFSWGPNGTVIASNTGGGLMSSVASAKPWLLGAGALVGTGLLLNSLREEKPEDGTDGTPAKDFDGALALGRTAATTLQNASKSEAAKKEAVKSFQKSLKKQLEIVRRENEVLARLSTHTSVKDALEAMGACTKTLDRLLYKEIPEISVQELNAQLSQLEKHYRALNLARAQGD